MTIEKNSSSIEDLEDAVAIQYKSMKVINTRFIDIWYGYVLQNYFINTRLILILYNLNLKIYSNIRDITQHGKNA